MPDPRRATDPGRVRDDAAREVGPVPAAVVVHVSEAVWGWVTVVALAAVGVLGLPFLLRGGGRLRGGRRGRGRRDGGYRVRVGPSAPMVLAAALLRRLDTVALVVATVAVLVLVVVNARA